MDPQTRFAGTLESVTSSLRASHLSDARAPFPFVEAWRAEGFGAADAVARALCVACLDIAASPDAPENSQNSQTEARAFRSGDAADAAAPEPDPGWRALARPWWEANREARASRRTRVGSARCSPRTKPLCEAMSSRESPIASRRISTPPSPRRAPERTRAIRCARAPTRDRRFGRRTDRFPRRFRDRRRCASRRRRRRAPPRCAARGPAPRARTAARRSRRSAARRRPDAWCLRRSRSASPRRRTPRKAARRQPRSRRRRRWRRRRLRRRCGAARSTPRRSLLPRATDLRRACTTMDTVRWNGWR